MNVHSWDSLRIRHFNRDSENVGLYNRMFHGTKRLSKTFLEWLKIQESNEWTFLAETVYESDTLIVIQRMLGYTIECSKPQKGYQRRS